MDMEEDRKNKLAQIITDVEVFDKVRDERKLLETIKKRQENWLEHIVRSERLLKLAIEGTLQGKRGGSHWV